MCDYSSVEHGVEYEGQLIWGKTFLKISYLKIKVDFKDGLFFTSSIICKNLWKDNREDVHWWQWQQSSKKLVTQQNTNTNLIRRRWWGWGEAQGQHKRWGFCTCISNHGGTNVSSKDKNIKNLIYITGDAKEFLEEGLRQVVVSL